MDGRSYEASDVVTTLAIPALGGGAAVFSGYGELTWRTLIGLLLILGAVALSLRAGKHRA